MDNMILRHICEVCGKTELLTPEQAHAQGWNYPPKKGEFGILSPRICGDCPVEATAWWAIEVKKIPVEELTFNQQYVFGQINFEPESLLPPGVKLRPVTQLFRPVGQREYELIEQSGFKRFPPRLPEQPIFYPVTNLRYAQEIAERWNVADKNSGNVGYVLYFDVKDDFLCRYELHTVGASYHQEYWIPAEDLDEFNNNLEGVISLARKFS